MRPARKSRERGLFKECRHLWDRCTCPWLGRYKHVRRVNLALWSGNGKRALNRSEAIEILVDLRSAIQLGTFDPAGRPLDADTITTKRLLELYEEDVAKRDLKDKGIGSFVKAFGVAFGDLPVAQLAASPTRIEKWMESLRERDVPLSHTTTKTRHVVWSPRTWNRYREMGVRLFNWARNPKRRLVSENPFLLIEKQKGERSRETRITDEQQDRLFDVCEQWMTATRKGSQRPNARLRRQGRDMYRRLCAALDTGLRAGEMGLVQVKHVDYANWRITLPWPNAKGGKMTGRDEAVWIMTDRLRKVLDERRFLGPEGYIFGNDLGQRVTAFGKAWRALFTAAGLSSDLVWHDARHEFVSSLIDEGGNIQEVKEAARHKSILTTARYMKAHEQRVKALLTKRAQRGGKFPV